MPVQVQQQLAEMLPALLSLLLPLTQGVTIRVHQEDLATNPCKLTEVPYPSPNPSPYPSHQSCLPLSDAYTVAYDFLLSNLPSWDRANAETLGFHSKDAPGVDGLDLGIATLGINISLATKQKRPWAWDIPEDIYNEYVVTYGQVNEARTNWRPMLTEAVAELLSAGPAPSSIPEVVDTVNSGLWFGLLGKNITFRSSQTPLIFDPMSTIVFGYASCTGLSILLADALRAAGVPARLAGTPAWNSQEERGNHNWVEVWHAGTWRFVEATTGGGHESLADPCDKWFCTPARMENGTEVWASRWRRGDWWFPLAWDTGNMEVPGEERTDYYQAVCGAC